MGLFQLLNFYYLCVCVPDNCLCICLSFKFILLVLIMFICGYVSAEARGIGLH